MPKLAAGIAGLPGAGCSFAAVQAAWRFFHNERITGPAWVEPLRAAGRQQAAETSAPFLLLVHDWSKLSYSLLAGLWTLLSMLGLLEHYDLHDLKHLAAQLPYLIP